MSYLWVKVIYLGTSCSCHLDVLMVSYHLKSAFPLIFKWNARLPISDYVGKPASLTPPQIYKGCWNAYQLLVISLSNIFAFTELIIHVLSAVCTSVSTIVFLCSTWTLTLCLQSPKHYLQNAVTGDQIFLMIQGNREKLECSTVQTPTSTEH